MIGHSMSVSIQSAVNSLHKKEEGFIARFVLRFIKRGALIPLNFLKGILVSQLQIMTTAQAEACLKFRVMTQQVELSEDADLIDPDLVMRDKLEEMKVLSISAQKSYNDFPEKFKSNSIIGEAMAIAFQVSVEICLAASELQWAIAEHDADVSARLEGFSASSKQQAEDILDRIFSAA